MGQNTVETYPVTQINVLSDTGRWISWNVLFHFSSFIIEVPGYILVRNFRNLANQLPVTCCFATLFTHSVSVLWHLVWILPPHKAKLITIDCISLLIVLVHIDSMVSISCNSNYLCYDFPSHFKFQEGRNLSYLCNLCTPIVNGVYYYDGKFCLVCIHWLPLYCHYKTLRTNTNPHHL